MARTPGRPRKKATIGYIHAEREDGSLKRTSDRDRKDIVLRRILDYALRGRRTGPTIYRHSVVGDGPLPAKLTARTRIHYGQYEKKNPAFVEMLRSLTNGTFELGMIARLVLRDFWAIGEAPTLRAFADAWVVAKAAHVAPRPEGAYLVDLARGNAGPGWKEARVKRAALAQRQLHDLTTS